MSDCGNGIKQMYERRFRKPDNKRYFNAADFYYGSEHLYILGDKIYPNKIDVNKKSDKSNNFVEINEKILLGERGKLIEFFNFKKNNNQILNKDFKNNIHYFENNVERLFNKE